VIYYTAQIEQFTIVLPFLLLWFYLMTRWEQSSEGETIPWALGILSGVLVLNKSVYLLVPPVGVLLAVWVRRHRPGWRVFARQGVLVLLLATLVVTPWSYRNYKVSEGRLIPVQLLLWSNFWADVFWDELDEREGSNRPPLQLSHYVNQRQRGLLRDMERLPRDNLTPVRLECLEEDLYRNSAWKWIRENPEGMVKKTAKNLWQFWFGAENSRKTRLFFTLQLFYLSLFLWGILGLVKSRQLGRVKFASLIILLLWLPYSLVYAMGRFSLDLVPVLAMVTGVGIDHWMQRRS
jgi:4-amino-4-deoxy-L-arabinose transferase-like glycosyltransferase